MTRKNKNILLTVGAIFIGWQLLKPNGSSLVEDWQWQEDGSVKIIFKDKSEYQIMKDAIGKPNIRYEFESNKELNDFVKNEPPQKGRKGNYDFSVNGRL